MLQIKNISKTYKTGDLVQVALDGVSLNLRDNEFVAILGPSGSGKTTLLNIIGGLDRYDDGDLVINGTSTKKYKDRDWDTYRNHTIGFVFQSYNLIPHQTILKNVELALTIAGVSNKERKQRALQALDEVGLKDQAHKRPNQMSGGQMQRVAIARALVNNPDILLADEPTGALDTKTSIQVMDLLQKVANDRLVVMVTHNPELANEYANRIVQLKDGKIISDTNPFNPTQVVVKKNKKKKGKAKMGYLTALSLSFNNLLTKKGRTFLTAFAGSIGIIGIALILSLSQGFQNYIDKIQEDTLSSYPLTITSETADMTSAILSMVSDHEENQGEGNELIERQYLSTMFSSIGTNDLADFKAYLEKHEDEIKDDVSLIKYSYSVTPVIYTIDSADNLAKLNPNSLWNTLYSSSATSYLSSFSSSISMGIFSELNEDYESYADQYDVLAGRWPTNYDEMVIVLSEPNSISDLLVYSLGLRDTSELKTIISDVMTDGETSISNEPMEMTYDDLLNLDMRLVLSTDTYKYNEKYDIYEDMSEDDEYMRDVYDKALKLKVVGVMSPKDPDSTSAMSVGVNFTKDLTQYVINEASKTEIVRKQLTNKNTDVFSGESFDQANKESKESKLNFDELVSIDEDAIKDAFTINIDEDDFEIETMSESQMQAVILAATNSTLEKINDYTSDPKTYATAQATVSGIYSALLQSYVNDYEKDHLSLNNTVLTIDAAGIATVKATITVASVKNKLDSIYAGATSMFTASTYGYMATDLATAFDSYFSQISDIAEANELVYSTGSTQVSGKTVNYIIYAKPSEPLVTNKTSLAILTGLSSTYTNINTAILDFYKSTCISSAIGTSTSSIMAPLVSSMSGLSDLFSEDIMTVDTDKFAEAFKFDMDEDELSRIMETMLSDTEEKSYSSNLIELGYQDVDDPSSISFYFNDFDSKENFLDFLDEYNEGKDEEEQISYTDITGILMSSVKTIVDSVTYVLIAFVSISLIVSSIMIAVITLISVMERTKEIGILRAMGASKHNVSSIFNAETFIIGLLSGLIGVGFTFAVIPPINKLIHDLTGNYDINAVLPSKYAIILILISVFLTIIAGIIPSRKAAKQDPVIALRSE